MPSLLKYRLKRMNRYVLARLALFSPRFSPLLQSSIPLMQMAYQNGAPSKTLIIFLPGIDDVAEDFARRGFIDEMQRQGVTADAVAIDAHYGYYATRVIHARITDDVIVSARSAGYEHIWLAGVSLGGFGAASYAAQHASHISGLLLCAPYLGSAELVKEIDSSGGIRNWEPGDVREDDYPRALWKWFKQHVANATPALPIYLGYGTRDMFERAHALLADVLPQSQVFSIPGGHDWRTWKTVWQMFLGRWDAGTHTDL